MNRQILEACIPCMIAMVLAFFVAWLLLKISGARLNLRRLKSIHSCQDGGVQSLSFVLTMPLFLVVVMFIVQVSQLMIGTMVVNYAAYAGARSATVWVAAATNEEDFGQNKMDDDLTESRDGRAVITAAGLESKPLKYRKIFTAVAMACAPVCPSRNTGQDLTPAAQNIAQTMQYTYAALDPASTENSRVPVRVENKIAYAFNNTVVHVEFEDKHTRQGPTYNPRRLVVEEDGTTYRVWDRHEVGWDDPVTIRVSHQLAMIPGPGRLLAKYLVRADGEPDRISGRVANRAGLYSTAITASATMTNDGFKSVMPYVQNQ